MKKETGVAALAFTTLLASSATSAEDWKLSVSPAIDLAYKKAEISMQVGGGSFNNLIQPSYQTLTPSLGVSYGPLYALVSYDTTIEDWNSDSVSVIVPGFWSMVQDSYQRNEASATVGYRVFRGNQQFGPVSVFGGYLQGTSVWRENVHTSSISGLPVFGTYESTRTYVESGYYLGANYAHSFGDKGTLSVSVAYAFLDGTLNETGLSFSSVLGSAYSNADYIASARGLSTGLVWTGPISGNLNYRVGMKYVDYSFPVTEKRDNTTGVVTPQSGFTISERVYSFFFGVSGFF